MCKFVDLEHLRMLFCENVRLKLLQLLYVLGVAEVPTDSISEV